MTDLQALSREELRVMARDRGVEETSVMTRDELLDVLGVLEARASVAPPPIPSGWLGTARALLADVVEQGLNLPDAAALIRGQMPSARPLTPAVPTVTLARIYANQGHKKQATKILRAVLDEEPDHTAARELLDAIVPAAPQPSAVAESEPAPRTEPVTRDAAAVDDEPATLSPPEGVEEDEAPTVPPAEAFDDDEALTLRPHHPAATSEPAAAVDDAPERSTPPSGQRWTADAAIVLVRDGSGLRARWRVGDEPEPGVLRLRWFAASPSWDGSRRAEGDVILTGTAGQQPLVFDEPTVVRAALCWAPEGVDAEADEQVLAVAPVVDGGELRFRPSERIDYQSRIQAVSAVPGA